MKFRVCRSLRNGSLIDVGIPAMRIDALTLTAPDADTALERARLLVQDSRNLVVILESN